MSKGCDTKVATIPEHAPDIISTVLIARFNFSWFPMNGSRESEEASWEALVADDYYYFCGVVEGIEVEVGIARPTDWELLVCGVATIKQLLAFI